MELRHLTFVVGCYFFIEKISVIAYNCYRTRNKNLRFYNYNESFMKNNRYIAYFDVLGYKEVVENLKLEDIKNMMNKLYIFLEMTVKSVGICDDVNDIDYIIFSDSIIIYSDNISENSFKKIVSISTALLYISLRQSRPLRCAISHGEFYIDKERNIFFGKALVDAYLIESKQKWSGACISKDTIKFINNKYPSCVEFMKDTIRFILEYDIPIGYEWASGYNKEGEIKLNCKNNHFVYKNIDIQTEK